MMFNDATRAQIGAARPDASTWLGANAGSGKTRVLTDRVARLLLNGVQPQHILCLTYTKAAASEMQNRLFKRLGAWAMLSDTSLRTAMIELGIEGTLDDDGLRQARRLFALAIETPGGLKIQTIHSFCASLLRRFPLEAGVSPQFTEIEDRAADLLRAEIIDAMSESEDAPFVAAMAQFFTGEDFGRLTRRIVGMREGFVAEQSLGDILELLGQPVNQTLSNIEKSVFLGGEADLIQRILPHLIAKGGNDEKAGRILQGIPGLDVSSLDVLERVFLTGSGAKQPYTAKIGSFPTKPTQTVIASDLPELEALMSRVEEARDARLSLAAAEKSHALHHFAQRFLKRYEIAKEQRGWLDFDDLILKARALLRDKAVAAWVLYRIDGGIDHILVDEAQDTSPRQWDVIERLTDEFYSGSGARAAVDRTLFVVGDKKQSIYSFQGADPLEFDRKSILFKDKVEGAKQLFQYRSLDYSFRSSSAILRVVDTVFDPRRRADFDAESKHIAFKDALPGRVDLWPLVDKADAEEDRPWTDPVDRRSAQHHTVILANKIAAEIKELIESHQYIPDDGPNGTVVKRRIRAGDFLILVQRRSALFAELIRACKEKDLPIAGADRLKVGAELAVKDLGALLSFLATPDDDLSLATALRSPLFGWTEQDLFHLAHRRGQKHLWEYLRDQTSTYPETVTILRELRAQVDFLRPYDLTERILTRHAGRCRLLSRLGSEAEDGINAMLGQALAYERTAVPSLTGFIEWMQTDALEIKRQIDSASNQIRVMTVHGAKGLEAPIVILPDTGKRDVVIKDEIITMEDVPVWKPSTADLPDRMRVALDGMKQAQLAERLRLLYVAMTRAEKWLIIAAAGDLSKDKSDWYQIAKEAMGHANAVEVGSAGVKRYQEGVWDALTEIETAEVPDMTGSLEPVFEEAAKPASETEGALSPSDLGGPKALAGDEGQDKEAAMAYGTLVHSLLEALPHIDPARWSAKAAQLAIGVDVESQENALGEARACITSENLVQLFDRSTLTEVAVTAKVGGKTMYGLIDRLIIDDNSVTIIDYKSNRIVPETQSACPEGVLRQMGAYIALLEPLYPDLKIKAAILWTSAARLMPLDHESVTAALWRSPCLDAPHVHS